jgi:hypothetical protein
MSKTLTKLQARFKITSSNDRSAKGYATLLAAMTMDEIASTSSEFPEAMEAVMNRLPDRDRQLTIMMAIDKPFRELVWAISCGMLEALTTEGAAS